MNDMPYFMAISLLRIKMDEESTLLAQSLETAGLVPSYWSPILAKKLGVISVQGLRYVGEESYAILRPFARNLEETKVIIKFLKVTSGQSHQMQREEHRKKLELRQGEYQQRLQHLKKVKKERKDKEVQQIERNMFELLQMPSEYYLSKNMDLNEVSSQLESFHENITNALNEADQDATCLMQSSSGGLALRGILLTGKLDDQFQERDILLKVPTNIELMQPSYAEHEIIKVFITNEEENIFNTATEILGYSVAATSSSGFCKSTSDDALSLYNATEKKSDYVDDPESTYCCTVKYFIVPLASYCFKNSVIKLSDNAVKHLKRIEKLAVSKSRSLQTECEKFFRKFGSHANRGPINFGGSYQWKSYSSDFKQKGLVAIQNLQREAIKFQIPLSADTAVSIIEYRDELVCKYPEVLIKNTFLEITRNGGPQEAIGLPDWKNGLIASSDTWSVVDRGTTLVPVWEIIELSHATDFQNSSILAEVMKQAMETMSPSHHELNKCTEAVEINEMIKEWNENEDMYSSEDQLVKLVEKRQQLARKSLNPNAWPIYCLSQQLLQKFLRSVIDKHFLHDLEKSKQSEHIKNCVLQLIEPTDLDIAEGLPDRENFCRLLYATEKPNVPMKEDNFHSVEAYFHYTLDYMYAGIPGRKKSVVEIANEPCISIQVTAIIANNVFILRKHLQRTKQYYEELFIVTILFPFNYDPDSYTFLTLISACDIEYLCSEYGSYCTQFFKVLTLKHLTKKNLQVYILSMAMELCEIMDVIELQRKYMVGYIEHKIGDDIDPSIAKIMQKLNSMNYDWKWFHDEIKALISDVSLLQKESRKSKKTVPMQSGYASHNIPKPTAERVASRSVNSLIKAMEHPSKAVSVQRQRTSQFTYQATEQHPLALNVENGEQCVQRPRNGSFIQDKLTSLSTSVQEHQSISKKSLPKSAVRLPVVPPRPISPRPLSLPSPVSPRPVLPDPPKSKSSKRGGTPLKRPTQMQQEDQALQSRGGSSLGEAVEPINCNFLFKLGLTKYCPQGLTVQNALEIREDTINTMNSFESKEYDANSTQHKFMDPKLYPFIILQSIMAFDYKCRIKLTVQIDKSKMGGKDNSGIDLSEFGLEEEADVETIHPMDGVLSLLHCADNFLRQDLMSRMTTCQLAIPLLLPDPFTGNLIFPLWAMRSIVKEWKGTKSTHANEGPLVSHPASLVSFLRIGDHRHSKSRILNTIINDSGHDWFFHYNCDGGNAKRLLVNGLAEVSWYLPSATDSVFPDVVTFANLHGDARELTKQVNFLSEISLMNFVLLNVTELADERSSRVLQSLAKAPGGLILLVALPTEPGNTMWKGQLKEVLASLPKGKCNMIMLDKNEADLRDKVRHKINDKITVPGGKHCVLEECTKIAHKYGITTDEDGKDCVEGKWLAYQLKDIIHKHSKPEKSAKEFLPLQGSQLWHEWSKHDKEQYRQFDRKQESPDVYAIEQRSKMQAIRQKQCSTTPSKMMKTFLENVVLHHGSVRLYFLQWLKMILDNLSRKQLAQLHSQYQRKKQELHDLQKEHQKTLEKFKKERDEVGKEQQKKKFKETESVCKKELKKLNEKIIDSSFGLEHLLREIGQVYEAVRTETDIKGHVSPDEKPILDLPRVAAQLLIDGHPLELMDGDAAHVPRTWVLAVLEQIQKILKNPSCCQL